MISHSSAKAYLTLILVVVCCCCGRNVNTGADQLAAAFEKRSSNIQVEGEGVVDRTLSDDREGSPHQRFTVRIASGQTVLIEHNIDLAERIDGLKPGDIVSFAGEYVWNEQGGIVHWTHRDPAGRHTAGWIKHDGRIYQ